MIGKRFYCDDELSKRDYAIFDLSKSDKSFNNFRDGDGFVELWRFECYLCDETNSLMTGKEVTDKLNELNDELGKLTILYSAKCKTEETLIKEGERLEKENKELKLNNEILIEMVQGYQKWSAKRRGF